MTPEWKSKRRQLTRKRNKYSDATYFCRVCGQPTRFRSRGQGDVCRPCHSLNPNPGARPGKQ